jgi:hypothetical protein
MPSKSKPHIRNAYCVHPVSVLPDCVALRLIYYQLTVRYVYVVRDMA